ncbi:MULTISPECIES: HAD family hydrolase [Halostella]|uniref:HAD family hydrolase n=1 Tax=Halostella TaxID=1843185 RepID=UPI00107FDC08|nr:MULTISPECIES: HAD family hydrolase [Halostella]
MAVSFDLFGTLVDADRPADPASAVARELAARDVPVPEDWDEAYRERHVDAPDGAEVPLPAHVAAALSSRGVDAAVGNAARRAVVSAFDPDVTTLNGARDAVAAAADRGPVALCSNCSVPELARRALVRSEIDPDRFDAVVTSVGCGWRKPHPKAFEAVGRRAGVDLTDLIHVGDDPRTDAGVENCGGTFVSVEDVPLSEFPVWLEENV